MASAARREVILTESARLFSHRGISATTIREIGDAVGLNSGTLYHYFSSKDAIVSEILISFLTDLVKRYSEAIQQQESSRERLCRIVRASLESANAHPYATEIYQNELANLISLPDYIEIATAVETAHKVWLDIVEDGVHRGEFNSGIDCFEFQRMMRECVFMTVRWHRESLAKDIDSLTTTLTAVFLNGFAPAPAKSTRSKSPKKRVARPTTAPSATPAQAVESLDTEPAQTDESASIRTELDSLRSELKAIREAIGDRPRQR